MPMVANGLGKLLEECGELVQIAAKKLAYFFTDIHPDGKGSIKVRMEEELGDVRARPVHSSSSSAGSTRMRSHVAP